MRIDVLTLFPELFHAPLEVSILGRAIREGVLTVEVTDIRDFAVDRHRVVDDTPYGGGAGMVMKCEPVFAAAESLRDRNSLARVVLMTPRGRRLTHAVLQEYAAAPDVILICGRYEGFDERVSEALVTDEISIGDYVLNGGELPALVFIEAISRLLPGVIGDWESVETDSFYQGILGPPQYTRPPEYRGHRVPEELLSGNHAAIGRWRRKEALRITWRRRPDLLVHCRAEDKALLEEIKTEEAARRTYKERTQ